MVFLIKPPPSSHLHCVLWLRRVWGKHTLGVLHRYVSAWCEITSGSRLIRCQGRILARKAAKVEALAAFGVWRVRVGGLERVKRLARRALWRLRALRRGRAFWGWWEEVEAGRAERERGHWQAERLQREVRVCLVRMALQIPRGSEGEFTPTDADCEKQRNPWKSACEKNGCKCHPPPCDFRRLLGRVAQVPRCDSVS